MRATVALLPLRALSHCCPRGHCHHDPAQDVSKRAALQPVIAGEADHLAWVYTSALYGTVALHETDAAAEGSFDENAGCLFATAT